MKASSIAPAAVVAGRDLEIGPGATRVKPWFTPLVAAGLWMVMALASVFHLTRGEFGAIAFNVVLGSLAAFIAWGRYRNAPIGG